jgi:hypothetical protein
MKKYLLARMSEASTWRGLIGVITAAGVTLSPEMANGIIAGGLSLAGFIGMVSKG